MKIAGSWTSHPKQGLQSVFEAMEIIYKQSAEYLLIGHKISSNLLNLLENEAALLFSSCDNATQCNLRLRVLCLFLRMRFREAVTITGMFWVPTTTRGRETRSCKSGSSPLGIGVPSDVRQSDNFNIRG
ncbi:hypothetical protein PoB_000844800 [Plakobranchus ocellatus]|uniref:Uncharacterized protein n=1 Tax=Plakobranchus ocellatus TaxID=259542 RepID=A0AAV3YHQ6_9GAST|nr:hypothetical protein PoB_000844800 [Plakobranchus ocellatus]